MRSYKILIAAACIFFTGQSLQAQWQYNGSSIYYNGNVGVGTTTTNATLTVDATNQTGNGFAASFYKSSSVAQVYTFESVGGVSAANPGPFWRGFHLASPYITQNGTTTFPRLSLYADVNSFADPTSRTWVFHCANSSLPFDMAFRSDNTEIMHLKNDGSVGIGTTDTKGYKLAVNGNAIVTKLVVKSYNNWPDYVFHTSYPLRPLSEVEQYIDQYHHLPEVPSAEEVKKNGLEVGENQAALLKKIEELTLYVIELNKRIQELEAKERPKER